MFLQSTRIHRGNASSNSVDEATRMRILGQRMRQAREQLGLSQEDLAHKWGKKQYQVSEYENGKRRIYAHDLPQLANSLHVEVSYFFQNEIDQTDANLLEETLLHTFRNLRSKAAQEFAMKVLVELHIMLNSFPAE
jgi:transcriptional regulator with XRE-family HTH domain